MGSAFKSKNLLLVEQILSVSLRVDLPLPREAKIVKLLSLKVY